MGNLLPKLKGAPGQTGPPGKTGGTGTIGAPVKGSTVITSSEESSPEPLLVLLTKSKPKLKCPPRSRLGLLTPNS